MGDIIFLGGLFPDEIRGEIEKKSSGVIQYAADALQWAIVKGLDYYTNDLRIVNLPFIGSYPKRYKELKIRSFNFFHRPNANDINVGFVNLTLYKFHSRYINAKRGLKKVLKDDHEVIIIYSIHIPFIRAAIALKALNPSIKICLIVPDLRQFAAMKSNIFLKYLYRIEKRIYDRLLSNIDSFVLLSDYMTSPLEIGKRPWVRVEGIYNEPSDKGLLEKEAHRTILYSGTLAKRYGVLDLLHAFSLIKDKEFRLWICGIGDATTEIIEQAKKDERITYFGQLPREEVLQLQKRATILVNPRTSFGEFTKYSFPSKTIEYLSSGTPCVMHRLQGVPSEYYDYIFLIEGENPRGLKETILNVCNKNQSELDEFGMRARNFILENKTPEKQCLKIYNLIKKLRSGAQKECSF